MDPGDQNKKPRGSQKPRKPRQPPKKQKGAVNINWDKWRQIYVFSADSISLEQISKMDGSPSLSHLKKKAAEANWTAERELFRNHLETDLRNRAVEEVAKARLTHVHIASQMLLKVVRAIGHLKETEWSPRDVARMAQAGIFLHRQGLGMDKPDVAETDAFNAAIDMFTRFLEQEKGGGDEAEKTERLKRFAQFLSEKGY